MHAALTRLNRLVAELTPESDGRLLDAFLAGSEPAFRELVARHGSLVFAVCNRVLRHRQDAEDAFQAVFLVLARRAGDVWPRDAVGSWLYGVAYRVALKARTLRTRRQSREYPLEDAPQPSLPRPEADLAEIIDRAVRKLPEAYRAAVVACDLEGLSRKDAAEQLGWKEGTLSGRLARARKLLADRLRKTGLALPAGGLAVVLGTDSPVRAGLAESVVELVAGDASASIPAPIAALTEGVVSSMFAFNLKAVAAAIVLACGLGFGAWASGAGDGPGAAPGLGIAPVAAAQPPARPKAEPPPAPVKIAAALEPLQGKWRIVTITEGKTTALVWKNEKSEPAEIEIAGNTLTMPYQANDGGRKREEYKIAVDDSANPKTIDLIAPNRAVGRGIYAFTAPAMTCATCHTIEGLGIGALGMKAPPNLIGLCGPGGKNAHSLPARGLKLAIATTGQRPTKFESGAEGVIEFALERVSADALAVEREALLKEKSRIEAFLKSMHGAQDSPQKALLVAKLTLAEAKL
jgi:RNA polymerase sigma factor (sigma-70 family)